MVYLQTHIKMKINRKYGYVRVSSKSQEFNSSIESQKQQLIQNGIEEQNILVEIGSCLLYTSPSPRDLSTSRMPSSA